MPTNPSSTQIFAQVEQEAYHACIEWALYLTLRQRQLEQTLQPTLPTGGGKKSHHAQ